DQTLLMTTEGSEPKDGGHVQNAGWGAGNRMLLTSPTNVSGNMTEVTLTANGPISGLNLSAQWRMSQLGGVSAHPEDLPGIWVYDSLNDGPWTRLPGIDSSHP